MMKRAFIFFRRLPPPEPQSPSDIIFQSWWYCSLMSSNLNRSSFFPPFSHFRPSTNYFDECHHIMFAVFLSSRVQHIVIITFMLAIDCIQSNHFRPLYFRLILTHIYNLLLMCFFPFNISFIHSFWWFNVEKKNLRFIAWASFRIRQNAFPDSVLMVSCHWMRADCARWHRQTTIIS